MILNSSVSLNKFLDSWEESWTINSVREGVVSNLFPAGSLLHSLGEDLLNE